jgi:type I restriction enzyme S subunit
MKRKRIRDIAIEIKTGKTPPTSQKGYYGDEVNWYTPTDLDNEKYLHKSSRGITQLAIAEKKAFLFKPKTVLVGCIGNIGKIGITKIPSSSNQQITGVLTDSNEVLPEYFYYWLKQNKELLKQNSTSAIVPILNNRQLSNIRIDYPESTSDQIKIAEVLSKAEKLIAQRKESISLLDEYLKSTFLEMFGSPNKVEEVDKQVRLGDFIKKITSGTSYGGIQKRELDNNEYGVLKVSAVTRGFFNSKEFKAVNKDDILVSIIHPEKGDLLFSRANTRDLVAATCIVDKDYPRLFLPDKLWRIELDESELSKIYFHFLFQNKGFKERLTREATGSSGSMLNISMAKLRNVSFVKPSMALQNQFAQIVEKTEALKIKYQESLQELENLFGSLSQLAFKGVLDLSKMEAMYDFKYEASDNDLTEPKKIDYEKVEVLPKKRRKALVPEPEREVEQSVWETTRILTGASKKKIAFNALEGNAILKSVFLKKRKGFDFQELEMFLNKEGFDYEFAQLRDFVFEKLEAKELIQYYADRDWMDHNYKPETSPRQDDFGGADGRMWLVPNPSKA